MVAQVHNARLRLLALLQHCQTIIPTASNPDLVDRCLEALEHVTLSAAAKKQLVTSDGLDNLSGAIMAHLEGECSTLASEDAIEPTQAGLWIIGRLRSLDEPLSAHVGSNEKTTMAAVLAARGPAADAEQRRVAPDPEQEACVVAEEDALRELFQKHRVFEGSTEEPPAKQQKLAAAAPTIVKMELAPLADELVARLRDSEYIRKTVQDARLQAVISKIDSSEDCRAALDEMLSNNSDFAEFVHKMVTAIGAGEVLVAEQDSAI